MSKSRVNAAHLLQNYSGSSHADTNELVSSVAQRLHDSAYEQTCMRRSHTLSGVLCSGQPGPRRTHKGCHCLQRGTGNRLCLDYCACHRGTKRDGSDWARHSSHTLALPRSGCATSKLGFQPLQSKQTPCQGNHWSAILSPGGRLWQTDGDLNLKSKIHFNRSQSPCSLSFITATKDAEIILSLFSGLKGQFTVLTQS